MPRHPGGRPSDLTPQVIEDVRRLLPTVLYLELVGDYLGVSRQTWRGWIRRGRKEYDRLATNSRAKPKEKEALYLEFFTTYKRSLAEGALYDLGIIKKASTDQVNADGEVVRKGEWQAAAWRAERRFPQKFGRKDRVEVTGKGKGGAIPIVAVEVVTSERPDRAEAGPVGDGAAAEVQLPPGPEAGVGQ
jgi:transposase